MLQVLTFFGVQHYQSISQEHRYSEYAESINSRVEQAIEEKQQTTIAMSIILSTILEQNDMNISEFHNSAVIKKVEDFSHIKMFGYKWSIAKVNRSIVAGPQFEIG